MREKSRPLLVMRSCKLILLGVILLALFLFPYGSNAKQLLEDWQLLTSSTVNTVRYHHEAMAMNGYVYILGGQVGYLAYLNSIERAAILPDGTLGQWTTVSQSSERRCYFSAVTVGKWMYLIGGENLDAEADYRPSSVERVEILPDGTFSQWTVIRQLPFYIYLHAGVSYGKYIYLLGGFVFLGYNGPSPIGYDSNSVFRAEVNLTDGSISEFTAETARMNCPYREEASAIIVGDNLYALCGDDSGYEQSVERAQILSDGHLGAWQLMNSTYYSHSEGRCAIAQDTYLFMVAGYYIPTSIGNVSPVEYATIDTAGNLSSWQLANTTFPAVRATAVALSYRFIYLPAGQNFNTGMLITDALFTRFAVTAVKPKSHWDLYSKCNKK